MTRIKTVTVVGASGTMGSNVAGIFASFGKARVFCIGRDIEKVRDSIPRIAESVRAGTISRRLVPGDFSMIEDCVSQSDLVFESVAEDMGVKSQVLSKVSAFMRDDTIACTGTSGLSVTELAKSFAVDQRGRFFGVHMFNPPYNMPLCEFIPPNRDADEDTAAFLRKYLSEVLLRTVVEVRDSPAFLANRIGFQFINEAMQLAQRFKDCGGIDYIDAILGTFTGRAMAPLGTADFVGLDVHKAIVDNVHNNTSDWARPTFVFPRFAQRLVDRNMLGRKTSGGLYQMFRYEGGARRLKVYDIDTDKYRGVIPYAFPFAERMKRHISDGDYTDAFRCLVNNRSQEADICLTLLLTYISYSIYAASEVGFAVTSADDVMATGFNWCPPLALYGALSAVADVPSLIEERLGSQYGKADLKTLLEETVPSDYDYRRFFKSGRKMQ